MSSPVAVNQSKMVSEVNQKALEEGSLNGRQVVKVPTSHNKTSCCSKFMKAALIVSAIAFILTVAGWTMYGVEKPACGTEYGTDCKVMNAGLGLGITGVVVLVIGLCSLGIGGFCKTIDLCEDCLNFD